ncbi:MAG: hypothetical protein IGQ45_01070 [Cyanobacterium sp. T60_A2020_053]|nr:hypothetical protein [Cyanobacterium sp. T60_A2020_053]
MIVSSDVIESIAQELSHSKEAKRAKKLVFYVSQRYWEADFSVVNSYSFQGLLESLYQNNPTVEDLKALLYHAVDTLNRKEVYNKIAKYVLQRMSELYQSNSFEDDYTGAEEESENEVILHISDNIQHHAESPRMKKLIFAVCKQYWENDINVIEMYDLRELIMEIKELYPSSKRLKRALENVVSSINRQNFYSFIADTIVDELGTLYRYEAVEVDKDTNSSEVEEDTQLIKAKINTQGLEIDVVQKIEVASPPETKTIEPLSEQEVEPSCVPEGQVIPWLKVENLFELKQEIMQYTNPLRAKILLFYATYQIETVEQHWSIVRTCNLDDLLIRMFEHHDKDIKTITNKLEYVANSPIEGLELEENKQTFTALIEAIKHFYKKK